MDNKPLVSVIIPTFRQYETLLKSIKSVISQTYQNFEILVIDDNVNYEFSQKINEAIKQLSDDRIKYFKNVENMGSSKTRNEGIKIARGKYITFLDDDDFYNKSKIENQVVKMSESKSDFSICGMAVINKNNKIINFRRRKFLKKDFYEDSDELMKLHMKYHITGTSTLMYRSSFLRLIGGFDDENLGDEFYLVEKSINFKGKLSKVSSIDVHCLFSINGLSSTENKIKTENKLIKNKEKYFDKLDKKDVKYIKMRHFLVMSYAYKKRGMYFKVFTNLCKSLIKSPIGMIRVIMGIDM